MAEKDVKNITNSDGEHVSPVVSQEDGDNRPKETFGQRMWRVTKTPGSAIQIVIAAVLAIAIGMAVTTTVDDIPEAAGVLIGIPGTLWLRALKAVGMYTRLWQRGRHFDSERVF